MPGRVAGFLPLVGVAALLELVPVTATLSGAAFTIGGVDEADVLATESALAPAPG